ncbi:MAG: heme lyase CcmF/NrfE family subunit [Candidatus Methanofastidiosia archaeon]
MFELGSILVLAALLVALASLIFYILGLKRERFTKSGDFLIRLKMVLVLLATLQLFYYFLSDNFRIEYVFSYSSSDLAYYYKFSALWAGQAGSFLLWEFFMAIIALFLVQGKLNKNLVLSTFLVMEIFLLLMLNFPQTSPFTSLGIPAREGRGLNPLLQDPWIAIHPPITFLGYALLTVPFSFAISSLLKKERWIEVSLPWTLLGWVFLGAGIAAGGYWSYRDLGWGGYWAWDPVENASLVPWLCATALLHTMLIEKHKNSLKRVNLLLAISSFVAVLYAAFTTRTGIIQSIHSFAESNIDIWFAAFLFGVVLASLYLLFKSKENFIEEGKKFEFLSRENFLQLIALMVSLSALSVFWGIFSPILGALAGREFSLSPEYYIKVNFPIVMISLILLALCPLVLWKKTLKEEVLKNLKYYLLISLVGANLLPFFGFTDWRLSLFTLFSLLATLTNGVVLSRYLKKSKRNLGGYLAHIGVGLALFGIVCSSVYGEETSVTLEKGKGTSIYGYTLNYLGLREDLRGNPFIIIQGFKGEETFELNPRLSFNPFFGNFLRQPSIRHSLTEDLYVSPVDLSRGLGVSSEKGMLELSKGESKTLLDYTLIFKGFELGEHQTSSQIAVGAVIEVEFGETQITLVPKMVFEEGKNPRSINAKIEENVFLVIDGFEADRGIVYLSIVDEDLNPIQTEEEDYVVVMIKREPGIAALWLGVILMIFGGIVAFSRRFSEAQKFDLRLKKRRKKKSKKTREKISERKREEKRRARELLLSKRISEETYRKLIAEIEGE